MEVNYGTCVGGSNAGQMVERRGPVLEVYVCHPVSKSYMEYLTQEQDLDNPVMADREVYHHEKMHFRNDRGEDRVVPFWRHESLTIVEAFQEILKGYAENEERKRKENG